MAKRVSLQMESTAPNGDPIRKSITYANPSATGTVLENFCKAMNNLTKNTYVETVYSLKEPLSEIVAAEAEVEGGEG